MYKLESDKYVHNFDYLISFRKNLDQTNDIAHIYCIENLLNTNEFDFLQKNQRNMFCFDYTIKELAIIDKRQNYNPIKFGMDQLYPNYEKNILDSYVANVIVIPTQYTLQISPCYKRYYIQNIKKNKCEILYNVLLNIILQNYLYIEDINILKLNTNDLHKIIEYINSRIDIYHIEKIIDIDELVYCLEFLKNPESMYNLDQTILSI